MSAAPCGHCGGQAISYRAHLVNAKPSRACDECGRFVRKKGFWSILAAAAVLGSGIGYASFAMVEGAGWSTWMTLAAVVALFLVVADYLTWRWLPWVPMEAEVQEHAREEPGPPESVESRAHT